MEHVKQIFILFHGGFKHLCHEMLHVTKRALLYMLVFKKNVGTFATISCYFHCNFPLIELHLTKSAVLQTVPFYSDPLSIAAVT
jgi:hypothetical protein